MDVVSQVLLDPLRQRFVVHVHGGGEWCSPLVDRHVGGLGEDLRAGRDVEQQPGCPDHLGSIKRVAEEVELDNRSAGGVEADRTPTPVVEHADEKRPEHPQLVGEADPIQREQLETAGGVAEGASGRRVGRGGLADVKGDADGGVVGEIAADARPGETAAQQEGGGVNGAGTDDGERSADGPEPAWCVCPDPADCPG